MKPSKKISVSETLDNYLKETLIASGNLTIPQVKEVFLKALRDYFDNKIDLNCLATVATQLYFEFKQPQEIDLSDRELGKVLSLTDDIEWINEHKDEKPQKYDSDLKLLKDYYEKNKFLLEQPKKI